MMSVMVKEVPKMEIVPLDLVFVASFSKKSLFICFTNYQ